MQYTGIEESVIPLFAVKWREGQPERKRTDIAAGMIIDFHEIIVS